MPPISIMIKPASSTCNMKCEYCFYHSEAESRTIAARGIMSEERLSDILKKAFTFASGNTVMLSFQGGEPLLAGKDYFRAVSKLVSTLNASRCRVILAVQTNGTLIDEEWCEIFKKGHFLVGLSLDGDRAANALRVFKNGEPTFDAVLSSAKLLHKTKVNFNILSVVTKITSERINAVYNFFHKQNFKHLQFIPCLRPLALDADGKAIYTPTFSSDTTTGQSTSGNNNLSNTLPVADNLRRADAEKCDDAAAAADAAVADFYLTAKDYENFLVRSFTLYTKDYIDGKYTSIRMFDNLVKLANSERAEQCGMNGHCCHQFVIEADGEVFPCDFYCLDAYSLGNIKDTDFTALSSHPVAIEFIKESLGIDEKCKTCNYYRLCKNGCKRERIDIDKCTAYTAFFPYALPHLKKMR